MPITAQKMKFSITDFFSKCDQIRRKLRIWSHLQNKSLMENFNFCAVHKKMNWLKRIRKKMPIIKYSLKLPFFSRHLPLCIRKTKYKKSMQLLHCCIKCCYKYAAQLFRNNSLFLFSFSLLDKSSFWSFIVSSIYHIFH